MGAGGPTACSLARSGEPSRLDRRRLLGYREADVAAKVERESRGGRMNDRDRARQSLLLAKIEGSLDTLSPNDRRIADYLLSAFPRVAWATVETVASDVGVSKAAVVRFSSRLGYDGFAELQREMQQE